MIFSLKTKVIGGRGCLEQLGETVEGFGVKKALLCTDAFLAGTPVTSRIVEMLGRRGIRCPVYTRLQPEPIDVHCDEGARFCAENGVELIVALGGGSVMDQSKAMAAIVTNGLPVRQLEDRPIPKRMLPLVCVPTTAGTGSEVTFVSVITNTDEQRKMTIMDADSLSPDVAICDPELLTTLPRSLIASWVGSSLTGALLTSMQYKDGYYTKREACVIMTCFSTAAFSFIFILTRTCGLEAYFLPAVFAIYAAVIPCAILLPRVWPLSVQKDEYAMESPEIKEDIPEGLSKGQWALKCAVEKAETMTVKKFVLKGVQTIASVWFDVLPMVMFVATTGMIVNEYTPVFKFLTAPFVPVLNWMGFAEAEVAAPMLLTGFLDQFLPVAMANALTAVDTRFFIFCVAIAQIIYMSEIGVMMIRSKVDFNIGKIFIVFLERTILSMPIIWACTRLLIH